MTATRTAICLINWNLPAPAIDDGSYESWVEGHRIFEEALELWPSGLLLLDTVPAEAQGRLLAPAPLDAAQAIASLVGMGAGQVFVAGHYVETDVTPFALSLASLGMRPVILFDICGTADPMAKWQALARAVDAGVEGSTGQQTLRRLTTETRDGALRSRLDHLLHAGFGEHALELSAA